MGQIMEFLLNLLLLKGKFLKTTAAETLLIAFQRCLQYRRRILPMDHDQATHMISSFENMLQFINYNARQYKCEGENYVVTSEVRYSLYEELCKIKEHEIVMNRAEEEVSKNETPERQINQPAIDSIVHERDEKITKDQNFDDTNFARRERTQEKKKIKHQDYIVDNLHAILKSQELLFKNIVKLVNFLEKDPTYNIRSKKLEKIKKKLAACSDVLSNNTNSRNLADIINNIIEDEITRCRFRHGESKTSADINLKAPRPKGIEAALGTSRKAQDTKKTKHKSETKKKAINEKKKTAVVEVEQRKEQTLRDQATKPKPISLRRVKSEPAINLLKHDDINKLINSQIDREDAKNLIEKNEEHFLQFENALWDTLTTLKYMSLKDEYFNMCKCAFHNKRHFVTFESTLCQQIKQKEEIESMGKFLAVSDTVFQMLESKFVVKEGKPEEKNCNQEVPAIAEKSGNVESNKQMVKDLKSEGKKGKDSNHMNDEQGNLKLTSATVTEKLKTFELLEKKVKLLAVAPNSVKDERNLGETDDNNKEITTESLNTDDIASTSNTMEMVPTEEEVSIKTTKEIKEKVTANEISNLKPIQEIQEDGNNLQTRLKFSEESTTKNHVPSIKQAESNKQDLSKTLPTISEKKSVDNFEARKSDIKKFEQEKSSDGSHNNVKGTKSNEDMGNKCSSEKTPLGNVTKKEFSQNTVQTQEESVEKKAESKYQAEVTLEKDETGRGLSKEMIFTTVKQEEIIKDILLATIEKEITNFIESGQKSQKNQEIKEDRIVTPAFMGKEDILLPLPTAAIGKKENYVTMSKLRHQQTIRNQQEANVIIKSQNVRKYIKNVSFPIVKKYEGASLTRSEKVREMSIDVRPKEDNVRSEQEAKVVTVLKKTLSCSLINKHDDKSSKNAKKIIQSLSVDKTQSETITFANDAKGKEVNIAEIEITDSGQQIYENSRKSQQLRKFQESSFRFDFKKEPSTLANKTDPPKITHNVFKKKYSFSPEIKPASNRRNEEYKKIDRPPGQSKLSLQKNDKSKIYEKNKVPNKDALVPKFFEKDSAKIVKNKENAASKPKLRQKSEIGKKKLETMSLQTVANVDGKLFSIQGKPPTGKESKPRSLSLIELKSQADLINMNKKVFDELEGTLHTVRIIINNHPVIMASNSNTTVNTKKRKIDEPVNKKFSTRPTTAEKYKKLDVLSQGDNATTTKKIKKEINSKSFSKEYGKSKTFLKKSALNDTAHLEVKGSKSAIKHPEVVCDTQKYPLRRTTKAAMKKQQVLTIFPKVSKSEAKAKPKVSSIETDAMRKMKFRNEGIAKHGNLSEARSKPGHKTLQNSPKQKQFEK